VTDALDRQLDAAERWLAPAGGPPVLVDGWEDGYAFCAAVCTTDVGLAFCRACPIGVVERVAATRRAASARCPAGVRLLAFPTPRATAEVGVLRVSPPSPAEAAAVADATRVTTVALRHAARDAPPADPRATCAAARRLRTPDGLLAWRIAQRERGADRGRTVAAALAQMIATSDEFQELYREAERRRRALERSRRQIDRLARERIRATEEERTRVGHRIHDTAAQSLVSAYRFLDTARTLAGQANGQLPPALEQNLAAAAERVQAAIGEVRGVLAQLVPPGLDELGVVPPIRRRLETLTEGTSIHGEVHGELPRLDRDVEQTLHSLVSEALSNAVRHAEATNIVVELRAERGRAIAVVSDDGRGLDPAAVARRQAEGALGLVGIARQASWVGGRATIASRRGQGTRVRISVPIRQAEPTGSHPPNRRRGESE
jgi:signal transduction histidine kinase